MPDEISGYSYSPDLKDKIVKIFMSEYLLLKFFLG